MSAKSSIQVCIKLRPCEPGQTTLWQVKDNQGIQLIDSQADTCVFDYVFDQDSKNEHVFDCMAKHIVESCIKGFNGTIFAYGQTSSGKTYTMMGDERNPGVIMLAAQEIFKQIEKHNDRDFLLRVGYIEIYNEKIYDLLNKKNHDLKIHESNGMVNVNCEECIITCVEDLLQFLSLGNKERTVGETNMNERSSRSHAIFRIIIESRKSDITEDDAVSQSLLNLVDLAGSERADHSGARGARLKEGGHINKSLHFLSNVIKKLSENEDNKYVSFRDSKLTRILQASLGGNAFTSIICSIKPSVVDESQSTLNFAMRAKKIRLKPQVNEIITDATMMKRLGREIKELKDRLAEEQRKNMNQANVKILEQQIKLDTLKIINRSTIMDKQAKNRRRTWCPASSENQIDLVGDKIDANKNHKPSNLPKPVFYTKNGNLRQDKVNVPKTISCTNSLTISEEVFRPAVNYDFEEHRNAMVTSRVLPPLSLSPCVNHLSEKNKEVLERDLAELINFTKIEKHINSDWEVVNNNLIAATAQIDELQAERLSLLEGKKTLQTNLNALTKYKKEADKKIEVYEHQLKTLKETVARLEMENRAAVDLETLFNNYKGSAELRVNDLVSALSDRDFQIENLQKSLSELSKDVLRNSKEANVGSLCPGIETSLERICDKCEKLEHSLEEHNKHRKPNQDNAQEIDCETKFLRNEIDNMRAQLENVQTAYKQMTTDVAEKSELCDRLGRDVLLSEDAKAVLQSKCDDLEMAQQRNEQIICNLQAEYESIQKKYLKLQQDYESLERIADTEKQHKELQTENDNLLEEISTLKQTIEDIQDKLMKSMALVDSNEAFMLQLKDRNNELIESLARTESKFNQLQTEYNHLSNEIMENVQEGDTLREQCASLRNQLQLQQNDFESNSQTFMERIAKLEEEIVEKNTLIDATEGTINEMREQMTTLEVALLEKSVIISKVEGYERQIADLTIACGEMLKVKENTINDSQTSIETLLNGEDEQKSDMIDIKCKLDKLQTENQVQLSEIKQRDELIEYLQSKLQVQHQNCIAMDVQREELQKNVEYTQGQLDRQVAKLADKANQIDQLQASNAELVEHSKKTEESLERSKVQYETRLKELEAALDNAQKMVELKEKQNKNDIDKVELLFFEKMEHCETENRESLRKYKTELQDCRNQYEESLLALRKKLTLSTERCTKLISEHEAALLSFKKENDLTVNQLVKEKHEVESMFEDSRKLVKQLQSQLATREQELNDRTFSTEIIQELHNKCEKQLHEYEQLKSEHNISLNKLKMEKSSLQADVDKCNLAIERLTNELVNERKEQIQKLDKLGDELENAIAINSAQNSEYAEKVETLNWKITDLEEQLNQAKLKATDFDKLCSEHETLKCLLNESKDLSKSLAQNIEKLETKLWVTEAELKNQNVNLNQLQFDLEKALESKSQACNEQSNLAIELQQLKETLSSKVNEFESIKCEKEQCELKLASLLLQNSELIEAERQQNVKLMETNSQLQMKLQEQIIANARIEDRFAASAAEGSIQLNKEIEILQSELKAKKIVIDQLKSRHEANIAEINTKLGRQIESLEVEINQLRATLKSTKTLFEADRARLNDTVSSLLEDKRNLEEKLCSAEDIVKKLEVDLANKPTSNNISLESNNSHRSPIARISLDREIGQPRQSISQVRKNQRESSYDERRQSYWNSSQDVGCMTDPVDQNCRCTELDLKLQNYQRELYITECKVTALTIELRNHPLKAENAELKKRVVEEHEKGREEIKRIKQKNQDLISKINAFSVSADITANSQRSATSEKKLAVETQTESDVETALQKMSDKFNDCVQLCRYRRNRIQALEEKLKHNENTDTTNVSSQTAGQINALKSQLESSRKEFNILSQKYEKAKQVLKFRRDEVVELRKTAGLDVQTSPK